MERSNKKRLKESGVVGIDITQVVYDHYWSNKKRLKVEQWRGLGNVFGFEQPVKQ